MHHRRGLTDGFLGHGLDQPCANAIELEPCLLWCCSGGRAGLSPAMLLWQYPDGTAQLERQPPRGIRLSRAELGHPSLGQFAERKIARSFTRRLPTRP